MRIFYSGTTTQDPRELVPGVDVMPAYGQDRVWPPRIAGSRMFLDSGAHTLYKLARQYESAGHGSRWQYFDTPEHWQYLDAYAEVVKGSVGLFDLYANVDAPGNPEVSYRNQRYLEDRHGLHPVPVVHRGADLTWVDRYLQRGHTVLGVGGLIEGKLRSKGVHAWIDSVVRRCLNSDGCPGVKLHGFAGTHHSIMIRYPLWSVDSTTWLKFAAYGKIWVPQYRRGEPAWDAPPFVLFTDPKSPYRSVRGAHIDNIRHMRRSSVLAWLEQIGVAPDSLADARARQTANLRYFEHFRRSLPHWQRPYRAAARSCRFGLC